MKLFLGRSGIGAAALFCMALAGCQHQPQIPPLPPQTQTPNIYVPPPPQPNLPPMKAPPPEIITDAKPTVKPTVKPKKHVKKSPAPALAQAPVAAAPPVEEAAPPPAPAPAPATGGATAQLGALAPAGASSPRQQQVSGHISAIERRLNDLPAATTDDRKKQVLQVRQFLKQATDALNTGDAEGADNLATKAGLLIDDIK